MLIIVRVLRFASVMSYEASTVSNFAHKEVEARVDLEVLEALHFALDAHQQSTEANVNRSGK